MYSTDGNDFSHVIWPFLYEIDCFSMMTWVVGFSVKLKWIREPSARVRKLVKRG